LRSQSTSADWRIATHIARGRSPVAALRQRRRASDFNHHGAAGTSLAFLNQSAAAIKSWRNQ